MMAVQENLTRYALIAGAFALLAAPAVAQAPVPDSPPVDKAALESCLTVQQAQDTPDWDSCIGVASKSCLDQFGGSTAGMSGCLMAELDLWDGKLNAAYDSLMVQAKADDAEMASLGASAPQQEPALRQMQRDWIGFRDAACAYEQSRWGGGTGGGPASASCAMTLTAEQYFRLQSWLDQPR
ncbi:MAG: lysozyme inhibitor LprI family protein [Paracoccus sp. (in: a-proteobacteria)]|uniref:lysozyme inhibitor LprI family protein n=1 Tax=Paracoccus sp. TaxID=267 RepID=UPI0026DF39C8|nr:lysozyme inhibitor LprI family protein [Paracoccus sp. (in: a-proteobacteria)]MDO5621982.1 lysozyme inhibitor LprI family protein [Paracoccus sp. (in: a-proteobacteria)]